MTLPGVAAVPDRVTVRAVVVSFNGEAWLAPCLDSLRALDAAGADVAITVVDNASVDGSLAVLARDYPSVDVLALTENTGFAGGVDAGIAAADADFYLLLNNDATLEPEALTAMLRTMEEHPECGAASCLVLLPDGRINSTGGTRLGSSYGDRDFGRSRDSAPAAGEIEALCGAAALIRGEALTAVGSFDPAFFLYYEDTDLSLRMREAGWTIRFVPDAVAHHEHSATADQGSALFRYYNNRNALVVLGRHHGTLAMVAGIGRQALGAVRALFTRNHPGARFAALRDGVLGRLGRNERY